MGLTHNVMIPQKYTKDGQEKTAWKQCGVAFTGDKGMSFRLDLFPGLTFYLFEPKPRNAQGQAQEPGTFDENGVPF